MVLIKILVVHDVTHPRHIARGARVYPVLAALATAVTEACDALSMEKTQLILSTTEITRGTCSVYSLWAETLYQCG